jgi:hypothetical protein
LSRHGWNPTGGPAGRVPGDRVVRQRLDRRPCQPRRL